MGQEITITEAGTYALQATNSFGCVAVDSFTVSPGLEFGWGTIDPGCGSDSNGQIEVGEIMSGTPPFMYALDGGVFSLENTFTDLSAGNYELTVLDASGCSQSVAISLEAAVEIFLDAGEDQEISLGETAFLSVFTNVVDPTVSWSPPDGLDRVDELEVNASPTATTLYTVSILDENGCTAQDELLLSVASSESNVYAPTAFSPNGDGINDVFRLYTDASIGRVLYLRVYDRWGGLFFEQNDFAPEEEDGGWDGTAKNEPAQPGVYVYVAEVQRLDGMTALVSGEVNLIR